MTRPLGSCAPLTRSCLVFWGGLCCTRSCSLASLQRWDVVSKNQESQTHRISPPTDNQKRQLVRTCQLQRRASLLCCTVGNSALGAKRDPKPGLLNPVTASGTTLWFLVSFN